MIIGSHVYLNFLFDSLTMVSSPGHHSFSLHHAFAFDLPCLCWNAGLCGSDLLMLHSSSLGHVGSHWYTATFPSHPLISSIEANAKGITVFLSFQQNDSIVKQCNWLSSARESYFSEKRCMPVPVEMQITQNAIAAGPRSSLLAAVSS